MFSWNSNCGKILRIDHIGWNCDHITLRLCTRIADWSHCDVTSWELHRRRVWRAQQIGLSMEIQYKYNTNAIQIHKYTIQTQIQCKYARNISWEQSQLVFPRWIVNCDRHQMFQTNGLQRRQIVTWHHGSSYLMRALCNVSPQNCKTTITHKCNTNSSQIQYKYIWECASVQQGGRLFTRHWQT